MNPTRNRSVIEKSAFRSVPMSKQYQSNGPARCVLKTAALSTQLEMTQAVVLFGVQRITDVGPAAASALAGCRR